jgi:hypothetical protein
VFQHPTRCRPTPQSVRRNCSNGLSGSDATCVEDGGSISALQPCRLKSQPRRLEAIRWRSEVLPGVRNALSLFPIPPPARLNPSHRPAASAASLNSTTLSLCSHFILTPSPLLCHFSPASSPNLNLLPRFVCRRSPRSLLSNAPESPSPLLRIS